MVEASPETPLLVYCSGIEIQSMERIFDVEGDQAWESRCWMIK
jgi:hypothetical protein